MAGTSSRRCAVVLIALAIAVSACGSSSSQSGKYDYGERANAFLDDLQNSPGMTTFSENVDFSNVSDTELIAAGHAFCTALKGRDRRDAERSVARRFRGEVNDITGSDYPAGELKLATRLGPLAVAHLCPLRSRAFRHGIAASEPAVTTTTLDPTTVATDPSGLLPMTEPVDQMSSLREPCRLIHIAETNTAGNLTAQVLLVIEEEIQQGGIWSAARYKAIQDLTKRDQEGLSAAVLDMGNDCRSVGL